MADLLQIPFSAGVDEGTSPRQLAPGRLKRAENCYQDKTGRIRKRHGTTAIQIGALGTGKRFVSRGKDLTVDDGTDLRNLDVTDHASRADRVSVLRVTRRPLFDNSKTPTLADVAVSGSYVVSVYNVSNATLAAGIYAKVEHLDTGAVLMPLTYLGSGLWPRVVIRGNLAIVGFNNAAQLSAVEIDLTAFTAGAEFDLRGAAVTSGSQFDLFVVGTALYVASQSGAGNLGVVRMATTYTITQTSATVAVNAYAVCLHVVSGSHAHLTFSSAGGNTRIITFNESTLATVAGATQITASSSDYTFCMRYDATYVLVGWCVNSIAGGVNYESLQTQLMNATTHAVASGTPRKTWHLYNPSKPWQSGGRTYVAATAISHAMSAAAGETREIPKASTVVVEIRTTAVTAFVPSHRLAATLENRTGWYTREIVDHTTPTGYVGHIANAPADSAGNVYLASPYRAIEPYGHTAIAIGFNLYKVEHAEPSRAVVLGQSACLAGGVPSAFDGVTMAPMGFTLAPLIVTSTNPGGSQAAGTYQYVAVYEWRSQDGVLHRSAPSPVFSVTLGASGGVSLTITTACVGHRFPDYVDATTDVGNPVTIAVYRTTVGGDIFYRLTNEPLSLVITNDVTVGAITTNVTRTDAKINNAADTWSIPLASRPQLYTETGELDDVPPPGLIAQCVHRGRLCGIGSDKRTFWATKDQSEDATVFPGFNEALTLAFDEDKTSLLSLDERIAVFAEHGIDIVEGIGPDATGAASDWRVYRVQTDVGCVNAQSLVTMPMGIMFESTRGIELLTRGLEVVWVGEAIEDTLATYPVITSAVLIPGEQHVRFSCTTTDGTSGRVLVFDYARRAWYVWNYISGTAFVDSAVINDAYRLLKSNGQVYTEDQTDSLDGSAYVTMDVEVPIYPSGAAAWQRLKHFGLVGEVSTAHDLTITVARTGSVEQTELFQLDTATFESLRVTPKYQKAQMFNVRILDATPTAGGAVVGTGRGPVLELLSLHVQRKGGMPRIRKERKA